MKINATGQDLAKLQTLLAQAVLYERPNGNRAIAMREVVQGLLKYGEGNQMTLGIGNRNETMRNYQGGIYDSRITIERSSDVQMVVSIMHEFLHGVDRMRNRNALSQLASQTSGDVSPRHMEIYQLQNQTLYDLTGTVDESYGLPGGGSQPITNPRRFIGPSF